MLTTRIIGILFIIGMIVIAYINSHADPFGIF